MGYYIILGVISVVFLYMMSLIDGEINKKDK
jgi:hypothetical protein